MELKTLKKTKTELEIEIIDETETILNPITHILTENEDVEYKFVCSDSTFSSGSSFGDLDGIEWRNVDNVAGLTYADGITPQVPQQYWAKRGLINKGETWYILVRDRFLNTCVQSQSRSIFTPAP